MSLATIKYSVGNQRSVNTTLIKSTPLFATLIYLTLAKVCQGFFLVSYPQCFGIYSKLKIVDVDCEKR
jgi:hypothetical protein